MFIYYVYINVLRKKKRKGMLLLAKFIVHMRHFSYLVFFLQALLVPFPGLHFRILFLFSFLPEITCNLHLPSHADTFSSILCQKLCHSKSFLYTPTDIILFPYFSQSHFFVSSLPGNHHCKNTEVMNRIELWKLHY